MKSSTEFSAIRPRPDIFANGDLLSVLVFRPHVNGVSEHPKRHFSKTLSSVDCLENAGFSFSCGWTKTEVLEYDDVSSPVYPGPRSPA